MARARLQRFRLNSVRDTGEEIGSGAYGVVKVLDYQGLKCAGKEIHGLLYQLATPKERDDMLQKFAEECELLSGLDHPNIVKFLGVHLATSSELPSLVMEYLPNGNLSNHLEKHGVLPPESSLSILRDVAHGLRYLHEHSPPIIHRDLTANNVLLTTDMSAKISDLGVAKILDMSPARAAQMTRTKVPGNPSYMPPEAMVDHPTYTHKIDIFSLGVLIVHVLSGERPEPSGAFAKDPQDPSKVIPVTEFDRRCKNIEKIEKDHPLLGLIQQCLNNFPDCRPDAGEVVHQLNEMTEDYYDFVLLGRRGMGKSTLGNKLLQCEQVDQSKILRFTSETAGLLLSGTATTKHFPIADDVLSGNDVTSTCELLANKESKIRILDVDLPEFGKFRNLGYEGDLQVMVHWVAQVQAVMKLEVRCVVYFLPVRGCLERADGFLLEELQVMHYFFGLNIFECMVVIATAHRRRRHQELGLDEEDMEDTKKVFHLALKRATRNEKILCPPVVYIGIHDRYTEVVDKLKKAPVLKEELLELEFTHNVCSRCACNIKTHKIGHHKEEVLSVLDASGCVTPYLESKCHPCFVQKYTTGEKVAGGFAHIATLGISMMVASIKGSTTWPTFTTADEECPVCKKPPGSPGCTKVKEVIRCDWLPDSPDETLVVDHTYKL